MSGGRTPWEVLSAHQTALQRVISCISTAVVSMQIANHRAHSRRVAGRQFTVANGERVALRSEHPMSMSIVQGCQIHSTPTQEHLYSITVSSYIYLFTLPDATEILAYHWHPDGRSHIHGPHLHIGLATIGTNAPYRPGTMHKAHFPTGLAPLASVIRMAIEELGVEPRRPDWDAILR